MAKSTTPTTSPGLIDNPPTPAQAASQGKSRANALAGTVGSIVPDGADFLYGLSSDEVRQMVRQFNILYHTAYSPSQVAAYLASPKGKKAPAFLSDPRLADPNTQKDLLNARRTTTGNTTSVFGAQVPVPGRPGVTTATIGLEGAKRANPRSAPYVDQVFRTASRYNVPWQLVWAVINHESQWDPYAVGDGGKSHGLAQIYSPAHPDIDSSQANNAQFAIDFVARNLASNFAKYHDWSLAVLAHNSPFAAKTIFETGKSASRRAPFDKAYIDGVFGALKDANIGLDDVKPEDAKLAFGLADINDGGAGTAGSAVQLPDPALLKQNAHDYLSNLFFREPTGDEVQSLVLMVTGAITSSAAQEAALKGGGNPFATGASAGFVRGGGGIVNPLPGGKVTGHFGDDRDTHQHAGVDLAAPEGTPVFAAVGGYVEQRSDPKGFGTYLVLRGDDGREYTYGHLSAYTTSNGVRVEAGAVVGRVGSSGHSTGSHLHFQIAEHGKKVNPEPELEGATALASQDEVQSGALATTSDVDPGSRMLDTVRNSTEYKQLYAKKPAYMSEAEYAQSIVGAGQDLLGASPSGEAVRVGLQTGNAATTAGYVSGSKEAPQSATFRQNLFKKAALISKLV